MALDQQLVRAFANLWCDLVGSDKSLAVVWGGWDRVSQVIRLERQNDTGLPSVDFRMTLRERNHGMASCRSLVKLFLHESLEMNAECERGGELLSGEFEPHDRRKKDPRSAH